MRLSTLLWPPALIGFASSAVINPRPVPHLTIADTETETDTTTTTTITTSLSNTRAGTPLPLLIWHGLGDRYDAEGLATLQDLAKTVFPGLLTYVIRLSVDGAADARATFFGNVTEQIATVCDVLGQDARFAAGNGNGTKVDALGFSQGGQFLRGLVERCAGIQVRSLVTFGSQHNGIAEFQECGRWDLVCRGAVAAVRGKAWTEWVQGNVVPAQYYRETDQETGLGAEGYLNGSNFLADVNNEREGKSEVYKERVAGLEDFAMYVFEDDRTVIPKESGWFAEVNATSGEVTELRDRIMYKEDWVGLKKLDEKGGLHFRTTPGEHMELDEKLLRGVFREFFGPERESRVAQDEPQTAHGVDKDAQNVLGLGMDELR